MVETRGRRDRGVSGFEETVLGVLAHPRYRGGYVPAWRIVEALDVPTNSVAVGAALRRLERRGCVIRRVDAGHNEWRSSVPR